MANMPQRYNLGKYNISDNSDIIDFSMYCSESLKSNITTKVNSFMVMNLVENLNNKSSMASTVLFTEKETDKLIFQEVIIPRLSLEVAPVIEMNCLENLSGEFTISGDNYFGFELEESLDLKEDIIFTMDSYISFKLLEQLKNKSHADMDILIKGFLSEELLNFSGMGYLGIEKIRVNISLAPGEVLYIDSNNLTVYKGTENLLNKYQGEWINIGRDIQNIQLLNPNLEGTITTEERFL